MQSPTPPTKPTPPTPPTMKTSGTAVPTIPHTPATATSQSSDSAKEFQKKSPIEQPPSIATSESTNKIPPLGSYSNSSSDAKETTSETSLTPKIATPKSTPSSSGFTIFLVVTLCIALTTVTIHWFKNRKPLKQQSIINYATESTDDIVDLILSQDPPESAVQVAPKTPVKKLLLKPATKPKNKGGFEGLNEFNSFK